jgi:2-polyprenyl-3-methyl-5-hydroxy-6-metoxy-1,4-benzoquinol methylase
MHAQTFILRSTCPLCGAAVPVHGERFVIRQFDERVRMVACPKCGLVYKDYRPSKDCLAQIYCGSYGHLARVPTLGDRSMIEHVHRMGDLKGRLHLDYGCGNGSLVLHARAMGVESYGADPFLTEASNQAHPEWLSRKDARTLAVESSARYDAVSLWSVIEHLENPLEDVRHLALCLKPQGRIYFDAPNADSWIARKCGGNWGSALLVEHLTFWTPKALAYLAEQAGCEVQQVQRSGIPYPLGRRPADERSFGMPVAADVSPAPAPKGCLSPASKQHSQRLLTCCRKLKAMPLFSGLIRAMLDVSGLGDQYTVVLSKR